MIIQDLTPSPLQIDGTDLVEDGPIYDWSPNSVPGTYGGITAWSGAAFDSMNTRLLLNGGGHSDYGGNEIYAFDFDTDTWSRLSDPEEYQYLITTNPQQALIGAVEWV